jgi:Asp-tRNA(Asn)/Glu-tRNA(Gln) amidotransferase A subunit family amidase
MLSASELVYESATSLRRRIALKEVSPRELVDAFLQRIEQLDPRVNSYLYVAADGAAEAARRAEQAVMNGEDLGPLHGIPFAVKDNFETQGIDTTCGSPRILRGNVPVCSATVVERLESAGAVLLGKLHMPEFASVEHHPDTPPARNPWDLARSPGGSSSGSAIAVAAGLATATLGTDAVASIRFPAAWCGVVGFKPTWGMVSRAGVLPFAPSLDHVGPLTRTVPDAALVLHCIAGPDSRDRSALPNGSLRSEPLPLANFVGLRIGWDESYVTTETEPEVVSVARAALDTMLSLGAEVKPIELPSVRGALNAFTGVFALEMRSTLERFYLERADDLTPSLRETLALVSAFDPLRYVDASIRARAFRSQIDCMFDQIDVLLCPVHPSAATLLTGNHRRTSDVPEDSGGNPFYPFRHTCLWNLAGAPAVSLPWGLTAGGLPLAVQLVGRRRADDVLLSIAARLEAEAPDASRRPPLA